jgi:hypothetical protein
MSGFECEVPEKNPPSEQISRLLRDSKRIAVVGLSDNPDRDSHEVAQYLIGFGYEIIAVNPMVDEVFGKKSYKSLSEVPGHIDIVDIFRRPDAVPAIVKEAIAVGAGAIWMQLGIAHNAAAREAEAAGLTVVQSKCIKVEHARMTR